MIGTRCRHNISATTKILNNGHFVLAQLRLRLVECKIFFECKIFSGKENIFGCIMKIVLKNVFMCLVAF